MSPVYRPPLPKPAGISGVRATYPSTTGSEYARLQAVVLNNQGAGYPWIKAATHIGGWSQIEGVQNTFNWATFDTPISQWWAAGKKSGLLVCPTSYHSNTWTPSWYSSSNPMFTADVGLVPVFWDTQFTNAWHAFLTQVAERYGNDERVDYIRTGFIGFESYANTSVTPEMTADGYTVAIWQAAVEAMAQFCANLSPKFQFSINFSNYASKDPPFPVATGAYAATLGMGLVSAGLQVGDLTASLPSNNFLEVSANEQTLVELGQQSVSRFELPGQSFGQHSGSLAACVPFAQSKGTQFIEFFTKDLLECFDPTDANYTLAAQNGWPDAVIAFARGTN